ncbi:MAG: DUF4157 domain-containing protein [Chlorobiaceae bacterium]|nr:DUF4157 domain-containing protein [Chlorobiaceae bacterium]
MAGRVMRMAETPVLQRQCTTCSEEDKKIQRRPLASQITPFVQRKSIERSASASEALLHRIDSSRGGGMPIHDATRSFMEHRFGSDFSDVNIHTDSAAIQMNRELNAQAFTVGRDIYFNSGKYSPDSESGKYLLAHELTHTIQQSKEINAMRIQRDCDDPAFCTPFATPAEAATAKLLLRAFYLPAEERKFGAASRSLYESYLNRHRGDTLAPVLFNDPASDVVHSFADSWAISDDQDAVIDTVGSRLNRVPSPLRDYTVTMMSLANFMSRSEMDFRDVTFSNPFSIAGHIAGGIGRSDAGPDYRKINYGNVTLEKVPLIGSTGYISVSTTLQYEVFDAVDFCPGDCGSPMEQNITIPMSRLEASNEAYDVPFKVNFIPASRSKRFFY